MRTLSQAAESKLLAAIEKAASYVNDGMAPNAAIIKSASESNIPSGHINLMVHAYNTGRTTKQRESGENTLEKAADFMLADANTVLDALFPKQVKTSQVMERETAISTEYAVSPKGMLARRREQQQKAASAQHSWPVSTYVRPPRDDREEARRQYSQKVAEQREYEELRRIANDEYQKAAAAMEELHMYFRRPGSMSFNDAVAETELRIGADGVAVLKKVAVVYPHLEKQAATNLAHFGPCEPCDLVTNVLSAVQQYNEAQKQADLKKKPIAPQFSNKEAANILTESILAETAPLSLKAANVTTIREPDGRRRQVLVDRELPSTINPATGLPEAVIPFGDPYNDPRDEPRPVPPPPPPKTTELRLNSGARQTVEYDPAYVPTPEEAAAGHQARYRPIGAAYTEPTRPEPVRTDTLRLANGSEQKVQIDPTYAPTAEERQQGHVAGFRPIGASYTAPTRPERPQFETLRLVDGSEQKVVLDPTYSPTPSERRQGYVEGMRPVGASFKKEAPLPPDYVPPPRSILSEGMINPIGAIANKVTDSFSGRPRPFSAVRNVGSSIARSMTTPVSPEEMKARTQGLFKALTDPDHELQLRNIRAKSVLNDLIRNDPVISSYDPSEVTIGFNEISEIAPSVAESPAIMTALLRKRLEGGHLADFDINQLMQMETSRAQAQNLQLNNKRVQRELIE